MHDAKHLVSKEKLEAVTAAAITACDRNDGVSDGVIDDPNRCKWDPKEFVGKMVGDTMFTEEDANVVRRIWDGPKGHEGRFIWHGLSRGANLFATAGTEGMPLKPKPFGIAVDWYRYFLARSPGFDGTDVTSADFELLVNQSVELFGPVFSAIDPDLSAFRYRGGKLIILHGLTDQLIPHEGTIDYYERVQKQMGGAARAAEFARLFLVPGVDHGFRGAGAAPNMNGVLLSLVAWVEKSKVPDQLLGEARDAAGKVIRTRPIFPYPQTARYAGTGDPDDARSFVSQTPAR
jgi:hypothetical protein